MIFHIAIKDLLIIFKDRKQLLIILLMPVILILILGSALGRMFTSNVAIEKFPVAVVNHDKGFLSQTFIDSVLKKGASDAVDAVVVGNGEARSLLAEKKAVSVITIPENFTSDIEADRPVKITVESLSDDKIKANIVESITGGFARSVSNDYAAAFAVTDAMQENGLALPAPANGFSRADMIMADLQGKINRQAFTFNEKEQEKNKSVTALQYYAAGMLLMFILFGANTGTALLVEERETGTLGRVMVAGVRKSTLIAGKFLGLLFICLLQAAILILFTALAYGVYWGGTVYGVALVTFCSVFAGAAMGMFIAAISKTLKAAQGFSSLFIQLSTIIGGGMIPIYVMPKLLQQFSKITVNYWGTKGFLDMMLGAGMGPVFQYCVILVAMGLAYLAVGIAKFRID